MRYVCRYAWKEIQSEYRKADVIPAKQDPAGIGPGLPADCCIVADEDLHSALLNSILPHYVKAQIADELIKEGPRHGLINWTSTDIAELVNTYKNVCSSLIAATGRYRKRLCAIRGDISDITIR